MRLIQFQLPTCCLFVFFSYEIVTKKKEITKTPLLKGKEGQKGIKALYMLSVTTTVDFEAW